MESSNAEWRSLDEKIRASRVASFEGRGDFRKTGQAALCWKLIGSPFERKPGGSFCFQSEILILILMEI